jgi:hypothetical protein
MPFLPQAVLIPGITGAGSMQPVMAQGDYIFSAMPLRIEGFFNLDT